MTPEQFVEALQSRGIELSVKNNRLKLEPGVAWKALTSDEVLCLKSHRADIKRLADGSEPHSQGRARTIGTHDTGTDGLDKRLLPSHHATGPSRPAYHQHEPSGV